MLSLSSADLDVTLLDPAADRDRMGMRYCTGGYIFQVTDARHGPLLTGPTYPESFNWRDGQGIPDAFSHRPLRDPSEPAATALVIGVGLCDLATKEVLEYCTWDVDVGGGTVVLRTEQAWRGYRLALERTVSVGGRAVRSTTRVRNAGDWTLPVCWFPHPFFPQPEGPELCRFNVPVGVADNEGYRMSTGGFLERKAWPGPNGFYLALDHDARADLVVLQRHPALGLVAGTCSYAPALFPVWGNPHTFSWEPFYERTLAPGQETAWGITYDF